MTKLNIAILVGSLRRGSINRKIANTIRALASDRLDCYVVEIADLPHYNQDEEEEVSAEIEHFREGVARADGILFCTPEYNRSIPGILKNAIDVGSRPYGKSIWDKKPGAIVSASPGAIGGFGSNHHLRQICVFLNMPVMQQPEAYLARVDEESFDENGHLRDGPLQVFVVQFADAFADWVDLIAKGRRQLAEDAAHSSE